MIDQTLLEDDDDAFHTGTFRGQSKPFRLPIYLSGAVSRRSSHTHAAFLALPRGAVPVSKAVPKTLRLSIPTRYGCLLYGIVPPKHLGEGKRVPDEDADELIPAVHAAALVQAPLAGAQNSAVDSEHHPPDFDRFKMTDTNQAPSPQLSYSLFRWSYSDSYGCRCAWKRGLHTRSAERMDGRFQVRILGGWRADGWLVVATGVNRGWE